MKHDQQATDLGDLLADPQRVAEVPSERVPSLLAQLAGLQATLLARLLTTPSVDGHQNSPAEGDRLLTAEEAGPLLGVSVKWLYRHSRQLPFARRLSRKALRFSETGLQRWLSSKRA